MYCVYITTYSGDKLPPKYLGSSSYKRICKGYIGSVSSKKYRDIWKSEIRDNKQLFSVEIISFHLTRKDALLEELFWQERFDVVKSNEWINLSIARKNGFFGMDVTGPDNPMFGKKRIRPKIDPQNISKGLQMFFSSEDGKIEKEKRKQRVMGKNNPMFGKKHSDELKKLWSKNRRGENHGMFGKTHSDEARKKISDSKKGNVPWNKGKKGNSWTPEFREKMMAARTRKKL